MKKFVSILLAVVLIFSVLTCVGCEADKKEENQNHPSNGWFALGL